MTTATETQTVMSLDSVGFAYERGRPVVSDVSAVIEAGRLHAVIGPNAAGKSTLLRLILGQMAPDTGRITLGDRSVHRLRSRRRAAWMSYVPQRSAISFAFTVEQIVRMSRYALPSDSQAVDDALQLCDLNELMGRPVTNLSVGQQQRVLLARAIAQSRGQGRIMLLDEPTSAMDLYHVHHLMSVIRRLADEGLAVVVVVHDLNLASRYADVVWLMDRGTLAAAGDWPDVLRSAVLSPVYGLELDELRRNVDPGDPLARRPVFDARLPDEFDRR